MGTLPVPSSADPADGRRFLLELDHRLERLDRAILHAEWNLFIGRSAEGSEPWQLRRAALVSDPRLLPWVRSARRRRWPYPLLRRLELLERILIDAQVEQHPEVVRRRAELQRRIVAFRPRWKGRRVNRAVVSRVARESRDPAERRRAYYALEPLYRPMEGRLRELVLLRNERAAALGYATFAHLRLGFEGVSPGRLRELAEATVAVAPERLQELRDRFLEKTGASGWHPWDLLYALHARSSLPARYFPRATMLPRILRAIDRWGFRTDRMRFRVAFHDVPSGGLTLAPDPPSDVRILVHPQDGWPAYGVMFHEVGHAVHSASIRAPRHLLRWHENVPGFGGLHEGTAGLFEEIAGTASWLETVPGVGAERAERFANAQAVSRLMWATWTVSWLQVEQALYRNPDRDPMPEAQRFDRRVFGFDDYVPLSFVDSFFVDTPVYAANYLLATLFSAQVARALQERFGEPYWPNRRYGPWLAREWFGPGSLYDWVPRVRSLTGRPFGAAAFRAQFRLG